jgi:hypothetical protein
MFNGAIVIITGANYLDAVSKYGINQSQVTFWKEV